MVLIWRWWLLEAVYMQTELGHLSSLSKNANRIISGENKHILEGVLGTDRRDWEVQALSFLVWENHCLIFLVWVTWLFPSPTLFTEDMTWINKGDVRKPNAVPRLTGSIGITKELIRSTDSKADLLNQKLVESQDLCAFCWNQVPYNSEYGSVRHRATALA